MVNKFTRKKTTRKVFDNDIKKKKPSSETIMDLHKDICEFFKIESAKSKLNNKFIRAVSDGKLSEVKTLLKKGVDINYAHSEILDYGNSNLITNKTALMYAIKYGHDEVFDFLISKGANVLYVDPETQSSALSVAIYYKRYNMIEILNEKIEEQLKNPSKELKSEQKLTRFLKFIDNNDIISIENMIKRGFDRGFDVNEVFTFKNKQYTPLIYAVCEDKIEVVKLLIELGANVDLEVEQEYDDTINIAIVKALKSGPCKYEIVKLLIENGAKIIEPFEISKVSLKNNDFVMFNNLMNKFNFDEDKLYDLLEEAEKIFKNALKDSMENSKEVFKVIKEITKKIKSFN
jgi:uncharacterized protein